MQMMKKRSREECEECKRDGWENDTNTDNASQPPKALSGANLSIEWAKMADRERHLGHIFAQAQKKLKALAHQNDNNKILIIHTGGTLGAIYESACKLAYAGGTISLVPEVVVHFNHKLFRGTRLVKVDANGLDAFSTPKTHLLGSFTSDGKFRFDQLLVGHIAYKRLVQAEIYLKNLPEAEKNPPVIIPKRQNDHWFSKVRMLHLYPGFDLNLLSYEDAQLKAIILRTYGTGNGPTNLQQPIDELIAKGILVLNCTECQRGTVSSSYSNEVQATSLLDATAEASFAKVWFFVNYFYKDTEDPNEYVHAKLLEDLATSWRGEMTKESKEDAIRIDTSFLNYN